MSRLSNRFGFHPHPCPNINVLMRVLSGEISLELMVRLAESSSDVSGLADTSELGMSSVSSHLRQLHFFQLVDFERDGVRHVYRLSPGVKVQIRGGAVQITVTSADGSSLSLCVPRAMRGALEKVRENRPEGMPLSDSVASIANAALK